MTGSPALRKLAESFRDWGRDCWCAPGADNTCGKRFDWKLGDLPSGYDHKYSYSHLGYNLKLTDMQAAVGCAQLGKLEHFVATRRRHAELLYDLLSDVPWLILPRTLPRAEASWFGFALRMTRDSPIARDALARHLNTLRIGTRLLFAGNLMRQPAYRDVSYRAVGSLEHADTIMADVLWIGSWPGLDETAIRYMAGSIREAPVRARVPVSSH
jgi:CDP-6-deoxy-D-xylo-4-hexulose-3-dehydrase